MGTANLPFIYKCYQLNYFKMDKKKKKKITNLSIVISLGLLGAAFGYFGGQFLFVTDKNIELPTFYIVVMILIFAFSFIVSVAIHELGHLITGKLLGFQFYMYTVGPFMWIKEEDKVIYKWNKNFNLFGGVTICIPENNLRLRKKFLWYVAGGPFASFIFALIMFLSKSLTNPAMGNNLTVIFINDVFQFHAFVSSLIFIASIIPVRVSGLTSDGGRILTLAKNNAKTKIDLFLIKTHAYLNSGVRPAELQTADIEHYLNQELNDHYSLNSYYYLYLVYFDRQEFVEAEKRLLRVEENLDAYPAAFHSNIWLEIIFLQAFTGFDLQKAEKLWFKIKPSALIPKTDYTKAEAALLYLKEDFNGSLSKINEALQHLNKINEEGIRIATDDHLQALKAKALEKTNKR